MGKQAVHSIPKTVWALGFVSMFMDISSEMIHSLLPVFLISILHTSAISLGLIEGIAEAAALITKTFSGAVSDRLRKRKALVFAGYALGTVTKPFFAMATGPALVLNARFMDRIGKGIRGAPRDALIADTTPSGMRGAAYGLRQSLDTVGALLGPLIAIALMYWTGGDFRTVFWVATGPGLIALTLILLAVKEPTVLSTEKTRPSFHLSDLRYLSLAYWGTVAFGAVFTFARFSEAFLLLRAHSVGLRADMIPFFLVIMNLVYSITAYPVGRLSDRIGRFGLLRSGLLALILADVLLIIAKTGWSVAVGCALWGLHMGLTQGLLSAMIADRIPPGLRATAFGIFSLFSGLAMLVSCMLAGFLWDRHGAPATFMAGLLFAAAALVCSLIYKRHPKLQA